MKSSRFLPLALIVVVFGGAVVWAKKSGSALIVTSSLPATPAPSLPVRAPYDPNQVHKTLQFYASQTRYDPGNAIFKAMLAAQYLESYRETGDSADATRAEQAARASLAIRTHANSDAYFQLSRALLTQHRFPAALAAAHSASELNPIGLRECADIEIEMGDYTKAERDIAASQKAVAQSARAVALSRGDALSHSSNDDPAFLALVARIKELHGDSNGELRLLTQAVKLADANGEMPVQSVAWFHERLGRCLGMRGRLDEAEQTYKEGLRVFPRDYRTMAALAHLYAARHDWQKTIEWGQKAADIVPAPETLALLGDAYTALGQLQKAATQFKLVEQIGALSNAQGVIYDRQRALYYADHGRNLSDAVKLARGELRVRHDIYTFDTLAWTLFKVGRFSEASANAKRALAYGTRDASLYFHAGMIAAAQKQTGLAQTYLKRALDINPHFHPSQPATARITLTRLESAAPASAAAPSVSTAP